MNSSLINGIFLYFDSSGTLKEIINDAPLRQGNSQVNILYVYWEGHSNYDKIGYIRIALSNGTLLPDTTFSTETVSDEVPYSKNRDLKYFEYGKNYNFYKINLSGLEYNNEDYNEALFAINGSIAIALRIVYTDTDSVSHIQTLGLVALNVESSPFTIELDENINIAQWNTLLVTLPKWISELNNNCVDLTSNQTISGVKTFNSTPIFSSNISNGTNTLALPSKDGTLATQEWILSSVAADEDINNLF